jgi:periplasmic protein TonB
MFDQLVETRRRRNERSTPVLVATAAIYCGALGAAALVAVFCFNPELSEASPRVVMYTTPNIGGLISSSQSRSHSVERVGTPRTIAASTTRIPESSLAKTRDLPAGTGRAGGTDLALGSSGLGGGPVSGGGDLVPGLTTVDTSSTMPPPPPKKAEPAPTARPTTRRVSEGVLQGSALQRIKPTYPMVAQHARISGVVMVLVTISEEGRVIEVIVISGHPFLRDAAAEAARQWVFAPTRLSRVPVKVQGILSFNFTL